jgi:hypothetical protein
MMPCVLPCADLYQPEEAICNICVHCVMTWHQSVPATWHQVGPTCQSSCGMVGPLADVDQWEGATWHLAAEVAQPEAVMCLCLVE